MVPPEGFLHLETDWYDWSWIWLDDLQWLGFFELGFGLGVWRGFAEEVLKEDLEGVRHREKRLKGSPQ